MKKLLLLALFLMPTMTLARESIDLPAQAETEQRIVAPAETPSETPSEGVSFGGGAFFDRSPKVTSPMIHQEWLPDTTYQFLTNGWGFVYFERPDGTRIYEMDYVTYHTIETDGKGTIYYVQIDRNGFEWPTLKVLDIE